MRTKYILLTILSSLVFASCNYLDFDETNNLKTKEDMYKYFGTSKSMLTHVYSYMPQGYRLFATSGGIFTEDIYSMRDCASDDGEFGAYADNIQNTNNGNWSPIKTYDDSWTLYRGIRAANSFIAEIAQVDFTRYEHDGQYTNWMKQLKYFPYEARVLRAHYFFELARRYGDIAMPLEVLTEEEANTIGKTPFSEVISFIVSECDDAANNLPDSYVNEPGAEIGRVTKGFAMAVKSKALLYAASKLHNPSMDTELWKKSAKAAIDIINTGLYSLDPQESANNLDSKEVVLMRINGDNSDFEMFNLPLRMTAGTRTSALWAINEVRKNADMPLIPSMGKDEFMERLYNEWRVEFAFEDHRFWDVRRWKIADTTQRELYGVKIEKQADGTFNFYKNLYETRNWRDCMYLYPIPQSELYKNTNLNPQNTGW